ncbi:MAG: HipA domain-containing protein [Saprospiraceae bacterium]
MKTYLNWPFFKIPHNEIEELYKRMVFNFLFKNTDDHLKNHSFIYEEENNSWNLAPAYDLTLALNPFLPFKSISRALSIGGKRQNIQKDDLLHFAETYTIKNPGKIISDTLSKIQRWPDLARENGLSNIDRKDQKLVGYWLLAVGRWLFLNRADKGILCLFLFISSFQG